MRSKVALLGIGAIGFVFANHDSVFRKADNSNFAKACICLGLIAYCIAIALSLAHRYWAAEFMESQIRIDRLQARDKEGSDSVKEKIDEAKFQRTLASKRSILTIWSSPLSLAIGIGFTGLSLLVLIFQS